MKGRPFFPPFFSKTKKEEKKNAHLGIKITHNTHIKRKKCLNQKDQRSGSIWVRRTPASACGTCSRLFFFESFCFFCTRLRRRRRFPERPTLRQSFVGGPIENFSSSSFFLSFPRRKLLRNQRRFFFFFARERVFLFGVSLGFFDSRARPERRRKRERVIGERRRCPERGEEEASESFFFSFFFHARRVLFRVALKV